MAERKRFTGPLTLEDVAEEAPVRRAGVDLSEYRELIQTSWNRKMAGSPSPGIGVTIPADATILVENRFREAAKELGLGCSVQVVTADSPRGKQLGLPDDKVRLLVEAREKRQVTNGTPKPATAPAPRGGLPKPPKR